MSDHAIKTIENTPEMETDRLLTFRMYQRNFDGDDERVYTAYWDTCPEHFVEELC